MKIRNIAPVTFATVLLVGCGSTTNTTNPPEKYFISSITHRFAVDVRDRGGAPVPGSTVTFKPDPDHWFTTGKTKDCITDERGRCEYSVDARRESTYSYLNKYESSILYEIKKEGYFGKSGKISNDFSDISSGDIDPVTPVKIHIATIYNANDYMAPEFGSKPEDRELRQKAIRFFNVIRLQSILNKADLPLEAFNSSSFKGKRYFQLNLNSTTEYNSLKFNKYDIGKQIFDESLRKILSPLNEHISSPKMFFGYDIIINGHSKNFGKESAVPETIKYRFLMPQSAVKSYKDQDIAGQQLLDASIILMNDERIELKLH